jgi:DNA-binding MarR family transcriptional regulator
VLPFVRCQLLLKESDGAMTKIDADEHYDLWVLLSQARDALYKARRKELNKYNINPRQSAVLFIIQAIGDNATATEIARYLFRETNTTYELLLRMEKEKLIKGIKSRNKAGRVSYKLTPKGLKAYNHSLERESIREIISSLTREDRAQLKSHLRKLRDAALRLLATKELPFPPS